MRKLLRLLLCTMCTVLSACSNLGTNEEEVYNFIKTQDNVTEDIVLDDIFYSDNFDPLTYWSTKEDAFDMSGMKAIRTYTASNLSFTVTTCVKDNDRVYILQVNDNRPGCVYITDDCAYLYVEGWDGWTKLFNYDPTHFEEIITSGPFATDVRIVSNSLEYVDTVGYCDKFSTMFTNDTEVQMPVYLTFDRSTGKLKSVEGDMIHFTFEPLADTDFITDFKVTSAVYERIAVLQAMWDFQAEIISQED